MTVDGSASNLSVTVQFEKISTGEINMTSTLIGSADDLFTDVARCGDH